MNSKEKKVGLGLELLVHDLADLLLLGSSGVPDGRGFPRGRGKPHDEEAKESNGKGPPAGPHLPRLHNHPIAAP